MENHKNSLDCSIPEYVKLDKKKFLLLFSVISFPMKPPNSKSFSVGVYPKRKDCLVAEKGQTK